MQEKKKDSERSIYMSLKYLRGVGEIRARLMAKLGIFNVIGLMEFFPKTYIHRQIDPVINRDYVGTHVSFTAYVSWREIRITAKSKSQLNVGLNDGKSSVVCTWFSYPKQYEKLFRQGDKVWVNGILSEYNDQLQLLHPDFEILDEFTDDDPEAHEESSVFWRQRRVLPVYSLTANLTQGVIRKAVYYAFKEFATTVQDNLPDFIIRKMGFLPRSKALGKLHFTLEPESVQKAFSRFAFEELFYQQLMWARHQRFHTQERCGIVFENKRLLTSELFRKLPFTLTGAQIRVIREIISDFASGKQMSRLLQGDVGSGKTIVVLFAMIVAIENGYQAALMAPTEILADQHYGNISKLLHGIGINIALIKGGVSKGKQEAKKGIADGEIQLIIGTHALLQKDVIFAKLGFVAVDEQHRFGVEQRALLAKKDERPHLLYLSATPIPRSLAMTVYGDLEVSILDEVPPNRKPVNTLVRSQAKIETVYRDTLKELVKGRQVYVVCPLIEESDKIDLIDAQRIHKHLSEKVFKDFNVELLHGKMSAKDKERIMQSFVSGAVQILVSTTVIEVGVDVPNASIMIVEHAERFGLAQLHQLRGRVGRGGEQAWCFLIEHFPSSKIAKERLATLAGTTDGFVIAEKDLELRGPGEYFGTEQAGMPNFRFANLLRDQHLLKLAKMEAYQIIQTDPELAAEEHSLLKSEYQAQYAEREKLILY